MKNIFVHLASLAGLAVLINLLLNEVSLESALFKGAITGISIYGIFSLASTFVQRILENTPEPRASNFNDENFDMTDDDFDDDLGDETSPIEDAGTDENSSDAGTEPLKKAA